MGRPDVVLENLANVNLDNDLTAIAFAGRVTIVGNRGRIEIDPCKIMSKDATVVGMALWNTTAAEFARAYRAIEAGLAAGTLTPLVSTRLPLPMPRARTSLFWRQARGKIVLIP